MKNFEQKITRCIASRAITAMACVPALIAACYVMFISGDAPYISEPQGVFDSLTWLPINDGVLLTIVNALLLICVAVAMLLINKAFILIHSSSVLFVATMLTATAAIGVEMRYLLEGLVLSLAVLITMTMMYASYLKPRYTRTIFTAFLILSTGSMWQWAFALYIPVMIVISAQMRCIGLRTMLASLMGVVTAPWLLWGFSFVSLTDFSWPDLTPATEAIQSINDWHQYQTPIAVSLTLVVTLVAMIANMIRVFGANAKTRAFNGVLGVVSIATMLAVVFDYGYVGVYVPLLCFCCGVQFGLYFHLYAERRAYISVMLLLLSYTVLYVWRVWNLI